MKTTKKIIKYVDIEYDGTEANLVDSNGNIVDTFYLEELVEEAMENNKKCGLLYKQVDEYIATGEERLDGGNE